MTVVTTTMADNIQFKPFVYWGQNRERIFMKIDITEITSKPDIQIAEDNIRFEAHGIGACGRKLYSFDLNFYLQVDPKLSKYRITGRSVEVELKKVGSGEIWPRLLETNERLAWLKTDFDRFAFDTSEDESTDEQITPHQKEMLEKVEREMTETSSNVVQDLKTFYLFLYNLFQWVGYCYIFAVICIRCFYHGNESRKGTFSAVGPQMIVCQIVAMLEILHSLLGWVKSSVLTTAVQVLGRNFILFGILMVESKMQDREIVWCLFLTWSVIEIVRYPYYLLATVKKEWGFVTWLRYTLWIPLYPVGFMFEGLVMLISMPIFEKSEKWNFDLPNRLNISFHFLTFIRVYMLFYVPGIYLLMQRMYEQRKKKIKMISPAKKFPLATRKKKKTT